MSRARAASPAPRPGRRAAAPLIRPATPEDDDALWRVLAPVFRAGDTYAVDPAIPRDAALAFWRAGEVHAAELAGEIAGTFRLAPNHGGGGAHVANAAFAVLPEARGRGLARAMRDAALDLARRSGYRAMQFNFVVETNAPALKLWREAGFAEIGRVPQGFRRPDGRLVDALILHRPL